MTVLAINNVTKIFNEGAPNATVALKEIDLKIETDEFVSIIGPSGCGKSTLLRIIGDLIQPTQGDVKIHGVSAEQSRLDQQYGMVFQAPVLLEWRRILQNVVLPMEIHGYDKTEREDRAQKLLAQVGLAGFENHYPWQLSGGMQQRVAIARALAIRPKLLLMDEPFGALDEMTRERMNLQLHEIWHETDTSVVFVTHSIAEAVFMSTKIMVMSARPGRILEIIDIDLPRERNETTREDPRFFEQERTVREWLRKAESQKSGKYE